MKSLRLYHHFDEEQALGVNSADLIRSAIITTN